MIASTSLNIIFKHDAFRLAICIIFWHHHGILCDLKIESKFVFFWFLIIFSDFLTPELRIYPHLLNDKQLHFGGSFFITWRNAKNGSLPGLGLKHLIS